MGMYSPIRSPTYSNAGYPLLVLEAKIGSGCRSSQAKGNELHQRVFFGPKEDPVGRALPLDPGNLRLHWPKRKGQF